MAASINASTTAGVVTTADTSGVLNIQTANTTAISISASQVVSYTNNPTYSGGTANGVLYLNGSKVATSGSALTFDGTNLGVNSSSTIDGGRFNVAFAGNTQNGICLKDTADASGASFWGAYNSTGGFIGSLRRNGTDNALAINGNSYLAFQQNSTEQMRLTSTGLGIGTSSPTSGAKLDVNGQIVAQNGSTSSLGYAFRLALSSGMYLYDDGVGANVILQANANNNQLYLQRTGNVGIGTSSPGQKLHVYAASGSIRSLTETGNTSSAAFTAKNSGESVDYGVDSTGGFIQVVGAKPLLFYTNATERMRLDSSGNLGLGVTPSAWSGAGRVIQFGNGNPSIGTQNNGDANFMHNAYESPAGTFKYVASGVGALRYQLDINNNVHKWYYAASGTAGNSITFTQAMTLGANGNLLVGLTSPALSSRLEVKSSNNALAGFTGADASGTSYFVNTNGSGQVNHYATWATSGVNAYHAWWVTASSGVQTQAMTLDVSGNLLVGTTSSTVWNGSAGTKVVVGGSGNTITSLQSSTTTVDQGAIFEGYATGISSNSAALGSIAFLRSNTSTTALSSYTAFYTNNAGTVAERARIDSSGNLLVGKTSTGLATGVQLEAAGGSSFVRSASTNSDLNLYVYSTGAGAARFYVGMGGTVYATSTTITAISDQRLKENIQDLDVGLDKIMSLKPRKFDWKAGKGKDKKGDRGWIAQEFEQVFPDMVDTWADPAPEGEEPYKAVNADLIPVLVKAIQEQQAIIEQLKADVAALKGNT